MHEFSYLSNMIQSIKPERGCISSVVFYSPDGIWWVKGKYFSDTNKEYIHPIMRLLNVAGWARPGNVYIIDHICPTCEAILEIFPQFDQVIVRSYNDQ